MTATHDDIDSSSTEAAIVLGVGAIVALTIGAIALAKASDARARKKPRLDYSKVLRNGAGKIAAGNLVVNLHTGDDPSKGDLDPHLPADLPGFSLGINVDHDISPDGAGLRLMS